MFINDLPLHAHTQVDVFADNTTLLTASDFADVENLENALSREVSNVDEWATNKTDCHLIVPKLRRFQLMHNAWENA